MGKFLSAFRRLKWARMRHQSSGEKHYSGDYISPITTAEVRRTRDRLLVEQTNYDNTLAATIKKKKS